MKIKVTVPIVKKAPSGSWERYRADGTIEIEFDAEIDESRVNTALAKFESQFLLIEKVEAVEEHIRKAEQELADIKEQSKMAHAQLSRVSRFLEGIGVNPRSNVLQFDEGLKLRSAVPERELPEDDDEDDSQETDLEDD